MTKLSRIDPTRVARAAAVSADDPAIGLVAFVPVGMSDVSSCSIADDVTPSCHVTKGQELGYFQFGGSTYCLVFRPGVIADFAFPAIPQPHDPEAPLMLVGSKIATATSAGASFDLRLSAPIGTVRSGSWFRDSEVTQHGVRPGLLNQHSHSEVVDQAPPRGSRALNTQLKGHTSTPPPSQFRSPRLESWHTAAAAGPNRRPR